MSNQEPELLDVRIVAFAMSKESPVVGLKRVFGIDDVAASRLIGNLPATVQRGVPLVRAEYFRKALELIGAEVELRTQSGELVRTPEAAPAEAPVPAEPAEPAERKRRELIARADTAPLPIKERTLLHGAAPEAPHSAEPAPVPAAVNATLREAVPAPSIERTDRTRVAPPEQATIDVPPAAPAAASEPEPSGAARAWGELAAPPEPPVPAGAASDQLGLQPPRTAPPAPLELAPALDLPPPSTAMQGALELGAGFELPEPPPAVRERRPSARILPGEVPPSKPPRSRSGRSSRPPNALAAKRRIPARADTAKVSDTRSFWESLGDALALPWLGRGPLWLLATFVWGVFTALASVAADGLHVDAVSYAVGAIGVLSLVGFAADAYCVAFRSVVDGAPVLAQSPSFEPVRVVRRYVLSAAHLMLFTVATNLPVILWYLQQAEGVTLSSTLLHPMAWLLISFPAFYWPAGLATAARHGGFAGIWKVHVGLRAIVLAPLEYLASAAFGALALGFGCAAIGLGASIMELPPALLPAALGLPLGLAHLLWGGLLGHLARAKPEAFEP